MWVKKDGFTATMTSARSKKKGTRKSIAFLKERGHFEERWGP